MMKSKKISLILVCTLLFGMIYPTMSFAASPHEATIAEAKAFGEAMGTLDGELAGRTDRAANKINNYTLSMPKEPELISRFQLNKDVTAFKTNFIETYRIAFQIAYNTGYRTVNIDEYKEPFEDGSLHGIEAGTVQGQVSAMIDFVQSRSDNWLRAYNEFLSKGSLVKRYQLDREVAMYQSNFTVGYKDAFMKAYIETFQVKNLETEIRNKNSKLIAMTESIIYFDDEYVHFSLGAMETEMRTPLSLHVPAATLYKPTYFSVYKMQNSFNADNSKYTPVSSKYVIAVNNTTGSVELNKPLTLQFEYYGSERAGVYLWQNNKWVYQYTTLDNGSLSIEIPAGYYKGGEYAIFIDENFKAVSDITFSWAYKEIYSLIRRGEIADTNLFMPSAKITRAELATLIYNINSDREPLRTAVPVISDASALGAAKNAANYVVGKRYFKLDSKGAFNPNQTVTYAEVEEILSMMFLRTVKWSEVSGKMMTEKFTRSAGIANKNATLTKAEAAYMLYMYIK